MVTFKSNSIDVEFTVTDRGSATLKDIRGNVKSFDKDLKNLNTTTTKLDAGLKAFSMTTFAGGLLNISSAVAQVVTSMSNLDKVQLQVKNSMVGVERAEDLLIKKTMMLNSEISKNGAATQKSIRLRNEIATATDDLANKQEKLRLSQDQVTDTYILFASNVTNTVFGTMQTLAGLYAMVAQRKIADTVVTAINSGATAVNTNEKIKNIATTTSTIVANSGAAVAQGGFTASITASIIPMRLFAASVMANPLFLPLTIATIGIGLAFTAHQINEMGKQAKLTSGNIQGLGTGVNLTTAELSALSPVVGSAISDMGKYSDIVLDATNKVDNLTKSLNNLQAQQNQFSSYGPTNDVLEKQIIKTQADLDAANKELQISKAREDMKLINKDIMVDAFKSGTVDKFLKEGYNPTRSEFSKVLDDAKNMNREIIDLQDNLKTSYEDATNVFLSTNDLKLAGYDFEKSSIKDIIKYTNDLSNAEEKGGKAQISNLKSQNKLLKENEELKKKLEEEWGYTQPGRNLRSFISGDTGYFTGEQGAGFSGYINKKTNEFRNARVAEMAWERVKALEAEGEAYLKAGVSPSIVAAAIEWQINKIKIEPNFVSAMSSFQASKFAQNLSRQIDNIQKSYRYAAQNAEALTKSLSGYQTGNYIGLPSFGGTSPESMGYTRDIESIGYTKDADGNVITTGQAFRNMAESSVRNYGTILASALGKNSSENSKYQSSSPVSGTSLRGGPGISSSLTRSKGGKRGGKRENQLKNMQFELRGYLAGLDPYYLGLTGLSLSPDIKAGTGLGNPSRSNYYIPPTYIWDDFHKRLSEAKIRISLGKEILALGEFDPDIQSYLSGNIFTNTSSQLTSILQREQAQITHQSALIGETTQDIIRLRNSPEPEFYDRIRYSERLEQISTGATVF